MFHRMAGQFVVYIGFEDDKIHHWREKNWFGKFNNTLLSLLYMLIVHVQGSKVVKSHSKPME